jgi:hypothetical protein
MKETAALEEPRWDRRDPRGRRSIFLMEDDLHAPLVKGRLEAPAACIAVRRKLREGLTLDIHDWAEDAVPPAAVDLPACGRQHKGQSHLVLVHMDLIVRAREEPSIGQPPPFQP